MPGDTTTFRREAVVPLMVTSAIRPELYFDTSNSEICAFCHVTRARFLTFDAEILQRRFDEESIKVMHDAPIPDRRLPKDGT